MDEAACLTAGKETCGGKIFLLPFFFDMLQGKKILLGVTGSIAAYKAALLTRLLVKSGAEVQVVMTAEASAFIAPLTLSTLSKHPVVQDLATDGAWNNHVHLGRWADLMLVAPATAHTLAKLAAGLSDNLLTAVYLSAACPVLVAPAMDEDMWRHQATQRNIGRLQQDGITVLPVEKGELASGLTGEGRMAEPETIVRFLESFLEGQGVLHGKQVLISAGPTYEPIDPVRFVGNWSSGKMGIALADAMAGQGAEVHLVLGPSPLLPEHPGVQVERVTTAEQMYDACTRVFPTADIAVMAAAVADYRPAEPAKQKIKKKASTLSLQLEKTTDILAVLGKQKRAGQFLAGFALETDHEKSHALKKLREKNLDLIVLNSLKEPGAGFMHDTNKVTFFGRGGDSQALPLKSKKALAEDITRYIWAALGKEK